MKSASDRQLILKDLQRRPGGPRWLSRAVAQCYVDAVRRSTGTCACSPAGFRLRSELAQAASPGWTGSCRLGTEPDTEGGEGWRRARCSRWLPSQPWTVLPRVPRAPSPRLRFDVNALLTPPGNACLVEEEQMSTHQIYAHPCQSYYTSNDNNLVIS